MFQRYRVLGHLGAGGMGTVYLAEQTGPGGFQREVVLKVIRVDGSASNEQRLLLLDEAQLTGLISHPNVVTLHEVGEYQGQVYLALERVRGVSCTQLLERIETRRLPIPVAAGLIAQACAGLHEAHALTRGGERLELVHRDVSMSNLMVDVSGRVRVIDFGIAHTAAKRVETGVNFVRGNTMYMAPEQRVGGPLDHRVDIYSTALVFYVLCAGRHPLRSEHDDEFVRLSVQCPEIPRALDALVAACLASDADERPDQISTLGAALQWVAQAQGVGDPAALVQYFRQNGISLEPPPPRPLGPTDLGKLRRSGPPPPPPPRAPPTAEVEAKTVVRRPTKAGVIHLSQDGPSVLDWRAPDGRSVRIYTTWLRQSGQQIALSEVLPVPLNVLRVDAGIRLRCDATSESSAARSALYVDAYQPHTRVPYLLLSPLPGAQSFDVGHRRAQVCRVSATFGEADDGSLVARVPHLGLEISSPRGALLLVTLITERGQLPHVECILA